MAAKQRTVYFFEPVVINQDEKPVTISPNFWEQVRDTIKELSDEQLRAEIYGRKIFGTVRHERRASRDYIYVGRMRPGADWPDVADRDGAIDTLASTGFNRSLVEPAYLVDVSGTNYVAFVRSSAGPSTSAIVTWLNLVLGFETEGTRLELRPYVRKDQLERLKQAQDATKLHLKIDPDVMSEHEPTDEVGKALKAAQRAGAGGVSVELTLSFGSATPTDGAGEELVSEVRKILTGPKRIPFTKASATVRREDDEGELIRDQIDFKRDRITLQQPFGSDENQEPTPEIVVAALNEAIAEFKRDISS